MFGEDVWIVPFVEDLESETILMKKKNSPNNSEVLFEEYCKRERIECTRVLEEDVRTPDYEVVIDGQKIIAEVKETRENEKELESYRLLRERGYGNVLGGTPGARVRDKIYASSKQIKARTEGRYPGIIVLYENGRTRHLDPYHIMTAMYGLEQVNLDVPQEPSIEPSYRGTQFGPKRKMTKEHNTSISAIATLSVIAPDGSIVIGEEAIEPDWTIELRAYHNCFAKIRIEPALLMSCRILQYKIDLEKRTWKGCTS